MFNRIAPLFACSSLLIASVASATDVTYQCRNFDNTKSFTFVATSNDRNSGLIVYNGRTYAYGGADDMTYRCGSEKVRPMTEGDAFIWTPETTFDQANRPKETWISFGTCPGGGAMQVPRYTCQLVPAQAASPSAPLPSCKPTQPVHLLAGCKKSAEAYQSFCSSVLSGNTQAISDALADDVTFSTASSTLPWSGTYSGKDGFFAGFGKILAVTETTRFQVKKFICNPSEPGTILVSIDESVKGLATGRETALDLLVEVKIGKAAKLKSLRIWEDTAAEEAILGQ